MSTTPSVSTTASAAERLDRVVTRLVDGTPLDDRPDAGLRPLVEVAALLRAALAPVPPGSEFEARLAQRLAREAAPASAALVEAFRSLRDAARRELRHPGRVLVTGAVSSAALGVGVTAIAVWRGNRRPAGVAAGLRHRSGR